MKKYSKYFLSLLLFISVFLVGGRNVSATVKKSVLDYVDITVIDPFNNISNVKARLSDSISDVFEKLGLKNHTASLLRQNQITDLPIWFSLAYFNIQDGDTILAYLKK